MHSGTAPDERGDHEPEVRPTEEAIERHLLAALDDAEAPGTRFHLRQALQLLEALES
ncbi:MAG: hypothetical protein ABEI80_10360 [Haloplanus sp.]